jgi:hypothetical protein
MKSIDNEVMFLRSTARKKDGKEHRYWSIVENHRTKKGQVVQRHVLYLGEINDTQMETWCRTIELFEQGQKSPRQVALFPADRPAPAIETEVVQIRLNQLSLHRPRQWGACWLAMKIWDQLKLDDFWGKRLLPSREGTQWLNVLKTLTAYRLIEPGSEWKLHRVWYGKSAMGDLLGEDSEVIPQQKPYRCLDRLLEHKTAMFSFLRERWEDLFQAGFDVLLYDLTSTYFECDPPPEGKRKYGYSRDKRSDCVQVVIGLIITPDGFPLAYEVMDGNTSDKTTLSGFLEKIERQYGKANRVWVMDRGIPTEEVLAQMRGAHPPVQYLVGTPRGKLAKLEQEFLTQPWEKVRESVQVKLLRKEDELYVLARSEGRFAKEQAMRRRRLKKLWKRLHALQQQRLSRDGLLMKLGAAKKEAGDAYKIVDVRIPNVNEKVDTTTFTFALNKNKLREARRAEGNYLLRSNLGEDQTANLWSYYIQLTEIEAAFRDLKSDLGLRPIYHQKEERIEAHIFVAFLAYCLHVTLRQRLRVLAPGLTPRQALDKFAEIQMVDVHLPTTDGKKLILSRYTHPEKDQQMLLHQLKLKLPSQPPPKVTAEDFSRSA